jgi:hypothetical protein
MKKYVLSFLFLLGILQGASNVFASHMREESKSPDLSYSVMLRTSAAHTSDTTGNLMIASLGLIVADKEMRKNKWNEVLSGLVDVIETMLDFGTQPKDFLPRLKASFEHNKIPADAVSKVLIEALLLANQQNKVKVTQTLMQCPQCKFFVNAGLEDAIEKRDRTKAVQLLHLAGVPETEIKEMMNAHPNKWGIHEFAGYFDYDKKGNAV